MCVFLWKHSFPVSQKLLEDFRELGIEIHDAYGLTEAPLITLNRLGANDITTVGPPLPDTKEILINSYGKNINLQKVETLLRDIPGISEALLVGEQRPSRSGMSF